MNKTLCELNKKKKNSPIFDTLILTFASRDSRILSAIDLSMKLDYLKTCK